MTRLFVSGTGTGVGKTWVTRGLARALARRGAAVVAVKPLETGCEPDPADAVALARACGRPELAQAPGLYRARLPLAPWAATLEGEPPPDLDALVRTTRDLMAAADVALVEGAGGVRVPLDDERDVLDLVAALELPLLLVATDQLGVLSHALTAYEASIAHGVTVAAVVLTRGGRDPSCRTNARILAERLPCPVLAFPPVEHDDDDSLADAAEPLLALLTLG
jgi:dethiobiotin synthetase